ncbi:MAG: hypothetical protein JO142_17175 [Burkholderiales bacterium]|nr:hypothetical protein [Burkholderiales bacterium]
MMRTLVVLTVLVCSLATQAGVREVARPRIEGVRQAQVDRFQHRERRLREAIERGDITPAEAEAVRQQRAELRKQRAEHWRGAAEPTPMEEGGAK